MNVFVKMFDNRLEIESTGGFPPTVTPANIYNTHHPRNPRFMDSMFYLQFVRCAREGTRRMRDSMVKLELPHPEFSQREVDYSSVRVILRNNIRLRKAYTDKAAIEVVGESIFDSLSPGERRVINFVAENQTINVSQVQRLTARSWPSAKKLLLKLTRMGIELLHICGTQVS
jgi:ATP-dependent DNA helicase RecG